MNKKQNKGSFQDSDPSRRLFLKRTGISSACLIASPLLASGIVAPAWAQDDAFGGGVQHGGVQSDNDLFFNLLREASLKAISLVPYVGGILSAFGSLVIPSAGESPAQRWQSIIDTINAFVDNKITDTVHALVESDLQGLTNLMESYIRFVDTGDMMGLRDLSINREDIFSVMMPRFATKGYEKPLINLYTIAANMHLGLLRDIALKGNELGLPDKTIGFYREKLARHIEIYSAHVDRTVDSILSDVADKNPETKFNRNEPLASVLKAKAQYQLTALDIRAIWPYFEAVQYPDEVKVRLDREIFSPLCGSYFDKTIPVPRNLEGTPLPVASLSQLEIRHYEFIDGMTINYGESHRVDMGGGGGKKSNLWNFGSPIFDVICEYANAIAALSFVRGDGSMTPRYGDFSGNKHLTKLRLGYPGHELSSIHGFGTAPGYGNVLSGCVFGFQLIYRPGSQLSLSTMRKLAESAPARLLPMLLE